MNVNMNVSILLYTYRYSGDWTTRTMSVVERMRRAMGQVCCSVVQCVAVWCSVLQCAVVCCRVL